jgi:hypothetical protein
MEKMKIKQQRDIGDLIQDAFILLYKDARPLWYNVFLYILPLFLLTGIISGFWSYELKMMMEKYGKDMQPDELVPFFNEFQDKLLNLNYLGMIVANMICSGVLTAVVYNFIHQYAENEEVHAEEVRSAGLSDSGWMIGFSLISAWMIGLGLMFFLIPGVYIALWVSLLGMVAVVERKTFGESLTRCREILTNHWLETLFLLFVCWIIQLVLNILLAGIARVLILPLQGIWGEKIFMVIETVLSSGVSAIVSCVQLVMLGLYYYSLTNKEREFDADLEGFGRKF